MTDRLAEQIAADIQWHEDAAKHYGAKAEAWARENRYMAPEMNPYLNTQGAHQRAADAIRTLSLQASAVRSAQPAQITLPAGGESL